MQKPFNPNFPQTQVLVAALKFFMDAKTEEIKVNVRAQLNEFDLLDPKHCVMHSLSMLNTLTGHPLAYFMNPLQTTPESPEVATSQPGQETDHGKEEHTTPSSLENVRPPTN